MIIELNEKCTYYKIIRIFTTIESTLFSVETNGHQPRVFFTLNTFIRGTFLDVVHRHGDFEPRGMFHKSRIKNPLNFIRPSYID